jgi:DNA-directed RNA polymerase subunit K/omega
MNTNRNVAQSTITRDVVEFEKKSGNIYESLAVISKRANHISAEIREELHEKLSEFSSANDTLDEVFENREQIEISKYYERLPKPTLMAIQDFLEDKIYFRNPVKEANGTEEI